MSRLSIFRPTRAMLGGLMLAAVMATAEAGPIADFETAFGAVYADYRAALFLTNKKDQAATAKSLEDFTAKWGALKARYGANPPPHYAEAPGWAETLAGVDRVLAKAMAETKANALVEAHETLEEIRDIIGTLRAKNGVITFSDHMNAYHEIMEHVVTKKYDGLSASGMLALRDDVAVLAHLAAEAVKNAPEALKANAEFGPLMGVMQASVEAMVKAVRAGDVEATKKARGALKPAYSQIFRKFG